MRQGGLFRKDINFIEATTVLGLLGIAKSFMDSSGGSAQRSGGSEKYTLAPTATLTDEQQTAYSDILTKEDDAPKIDLADSTDQIGKTNIADPTKAIGQTVESEKLAGTGINKEDLSIAGLDTVTSSAVQDRTQAARESFGRAEDLAGQLKVDDATADREAAFNLTVEDAIREAAENRQQLGRRGSAYGSDFETADFRNQESLNKSIADARVRFALEARKQDTDRDLALIGAETDIGRGQIDVGQVEASDQLERDITALQTSTTSELERQRLNQDTNEASIDRLLSARTSSASNLQSTQELNAQIDASLKTRQADLDQERNRINAELQSGDADRMQAAKLANASLEADQRRLELDRIAQVRAIENIIVEGTIYGDTPAAETVVNEETSPSGDPSGPGDVNVGGPDPGDLDPGLTGGDVATGQGDDIATGVQTTGAGDAIAQDAIDAKNVDAEVDQVIANADALTEQEDAAVDFANETTDVAKDNRDALVNPLLGDGSGDVSTDTGAADKGSGEIGSNTDGGGIPGAGETSQATQDAIDFFASDDYNPLGDNAIEQVTEAIENTDSTEEAAAVQAAIDAAKVAAEQDAIAAAAAAAAADKAVADAKSAADAKARADAAAKKAAADKLVAETLAKEKAANDAVVAAAEATAMQSLEQRAMEGGLANVSLNITLALAKRGNVAAKAKLAALVAAEMAKSSNTNTYSYGQGAQQGYGGGVALGDVGGLTGDIGGFTTGMTFGPSM